MIPSKTMERIREYALHMDWNVAFGGKSKGNRHLERTVRVALSLCREKEVREDIVVAGAWLHDIGLHLGNKWHCFSGARFIRGLLEEFELDEADIEHICHCIEAHDGEVPAKTMEARIVHDADTLDKMGPLGFIRHAWKIANITDYAPKKLAEEVEKHLPERFQKIYLREAKERAESLDRKLKSLLRDRELLLRMTSFVTEKSRSGVQTEEIVEELMRSGSLPDSVLVVLQEQLNPSWGS
ncbi:MAG: HD domain-containing protein [Thermoplasmata archaeon]